MDWFDHVQKEWTTLKAAPIAFILLTVLAFVAAVLGVDWLHGDRFASLSQDIQAAKQQADLEKSRNDLLKDRIQAKDDQLNEYRSRLLASPVPNSVKTERKRQELNRSTTRFSNASNLELNKLGGKLAGQIRELAKKANEPMSHTPTDTDAFRRAMMDADFEYASKYQADAMVLRDEILSRLPLVQRPGWNDSMYEHPTNPIGLEMVAADLDRLAKMLPLK